ncbi:methyl-accepting chemotaxis protein [Bradyrhizobium ontarionense]|uniref:Methyl-accepting chemotaxis protein n=1 Tax=Bradyrhizobium ontarionense TaxID=2898149 RepID=A0ABY3RGX4_9BRAD|nr:methyl-accepting chemotaxis protein [Bradyrhizobium sp. A19]UFZ06730.1 methyl-accepting chemotaxis protein [Bradyrhizobium sp. A19]
MMSFRLKIRGRLYAGFAALVAVSVIMAAVAVWNLWAVRDQVASMSALSDSTARILQISNHLQAIQRANLRYIHDANEPALKEAADRESAATELLQAATKDPLSAERRKLYNDLAGNIARMKTQRDALQDAVKQIKTGRAALLPGGEDLAAKTAKLSIAARSSKEPEIMTAVADIDSRLQLVRIATWRFLALRDTKSASAFRAGVDNVEQRLAALESATPPANVQSAIAPVKASLELNKNAFEATAAAALKSEDIYANAIEPLIAGSIDTLKAAEANVNAEYHASRATAESAIASTTSLQIKVGAAAILFGCLVAFLIARGIVGPLASMTTAMGSLASGDVAVEIPGRGQHDEIGAMATAIQVFKDNMVETERLRAEQTDAEARQAGQRKADMAKLARQFEQAVGEIVDAVSHASSELEASAGTLTSTASRAQDLSTEVAAASQEASSNVQTVASAAEQLSSSVSEISRQVQESARIAGEAVTQANRTNERVGTLSKAAARIGDVLELISNIAGQTNLLALNATIEAARAGEAGRGFAVVAAEVKALAEQTAKATGEIAQQVSGIQAATEESVGSIKEIGSTIGRLSEIAAAVSAAVEEQGAATQEISRNVQHAASGTQRVSRNIDDVQRGASETGSASSQVLTAARSLSAESGRLKREVSRFLGSLQAA